MYNYVNVLYSYSTALVAWVYGVKQHSCSIVDYVWRHISITVLTTHGLFWLTRVSWAELNFFISTVFVCVYLCCHYLRILVTHTHMHTRTHTHTHVHTYIHTHTHTNEDRVCTHSSTLEGEPSLSKMLVYTDTMHILMCTSLYDNWHRIHSNLVVRICLELQVLSLRVTLSVNFPDPVRCLVNQAFLTNKAYSNSS